MEYFIFNGSHYAMSSAEHISRLIDDSEGSPIEPIGYWGDHEPMATREDDVMSAAILYASCSLDRSQKIGARYAATLAPIVGSVSPELGDAVDILAIIGQLTSSAGDVHDRVVAICIEAIHEEIVKHVSERASRRIAELLEVGS